MRTIDAVHNVPLRSDLPPFRPGDTVRVHVRIKEGDKERIQVFEGMVIGMHRGGARAPWTNGVRWGGLGDDGGGWRSRRVRIHSATGALKRTDLQLVGARTSPRAKPPL